MDKINRKRILEIQGEYLSSYSLHLKMLTIVSIIVSIIVVINIISGLSSSINIFDIYVNPLLYYCIFALGIMIPNIWTLYNFKKSGLYMVYIINGLIQVIITIWFFISVVVSFLANIIITLLVIIIFGCISTINILVIKYYYERRGLFKY